VEERYADVQDGPGSVAGGGGEWKGTNGTSAMESGLKRARSPDDDSRDDRMVSSLVFC
jgi:nuclear cap-binding protein subunit 2